MVSCMKTYRIETERTVVRPWSPSDAILLKEAVDASREHLLPWLPWAEHEPATIEEKIELLRGFRSGYDRDEDYTLAFFNRDESRVLGGGGLHTRVGPNEREIGYWVRVEEKGKGIVTEAVSGAIRAAFEVEQLDRLEIRCDPENVASVCVAEKLGFHHDGTLPSRYLVRGKEPRDTMVWSLDKGAYGKESPPALVGVVVFDGAGRVLLDDR